MTATRIAGNMTQKVYSRSTESAHRVEILARPLAGWLALDGGAVLPSPVTPPDGHWPALGDEIVRKSACAAAVARERREICLRCRIERTRHTGILTASTAYRISGRKSVDEPLRSERDGRWGIGTGDEVERRPFTALERAPESRSSARGGQGLDQAAFERRAIRRGMSALRDAMKRYPFHRISQRAHAAAYRSAFERRLVEALAPAR